MTGHRVGRSRAIVAASLLVAGACGAGSESDPGPVARPYDVAFYSGTGNAGARSARLAGAAVVLTADGSFDGEWTPATRCQPDGRASAFEGVSRLAGWSLGRLGPIYFLRANPARANEILEIVLFDPGNLDELTSSCDVDERVDASGTLARWLGLEPRNRLVIMAGERTMSNDLASVRTAYLDSVTGTGLADQVLLCTYAGLGHRATFEDHATLITAPSPIESCPGTGRAVAV